LETKYPRYPLKSRNSQAVNKLEGRLRASPGPGRRDKDFLNPKATLVKSIVSQVGQAEQKGLVTVQGIQKVVNIRPSSGCKRYLVTDCSDTQQKRGLRLCLGRASTVIARSRSTRQPEHIPFRFLPDNPYLVFPLWRVMRSELPGCENRRDTITPASERW